MYSRAFFRASRALPGTFIWATETVSRFPASELATWGRRRFTEAKPSSTKTRSRASTTPEVVATSGVVEARERVFVDEGFASVNLRLPQVANSEAGNRDTVSVAQMKVPGKARDALKKAREYMQKQKLDDSAKYVAKALEIYPQFAEALALRGL